MLRLFNNNSIVLAFFLVFGVAGSLSAEGSVYCKKLYLDQFSPARETDGSWLDDGQGTDASTCEYQIYYVEYGYYCRQVNPGRTFFSPAYVSDGSWVNDRPGTSLEVCLDDVWDLL